MWKKEGSMNKKIVWLAAMILLILIAGSAGCIAEKKVYTVGVSSALEPFSAKNAVTGDPYGIDIDIIDWIAKDQGFDVVYTYIGADKYLDALDAGTVDVVTGKVITEDRLKRCDFTDVYYTAKYGLVVRKDSNVTLDEVLRGQASIAANSGSAYEKWLKAHHGEDTFNELVAAGKIIIKPSVNAVIYSVLAKEADSGMTSGGSISQMLNEYTPLMFAGYISEGNDAGFSVAKSNPELLKILNNGLRNMKASGEYDQVMKAYGIPHVKSAYKVGTDKDNYPYSHLDENGNFTGFDIDSIRWIAEQNGFAVTFEDIPWSKNINAIVTGTIDMFASGMSITPERLEKVAFSNPYMTEGMSVFSQPQSPVSKADFEAGKISVGVIYGTADERFLKNLLGSELYDTMLMKKTIKMYDSQADLEKGLQSGQVAVILDNTGSDSYYEKMLTMKLVASYPDTDRFGYAMSNGDIELQDVVNKGLAALESSGKRAELLATYGLD